MKGRRARGKQPDVLIVEDDLDARTVLSDLLQHEGYRVATATDGQVALDLLRQGVRPCLMLVDRQMDRMGGDQLVREVAASPFAGIAVVVLTAHPARARDLGVRAVLQKPVDSQALLGVIEQFCTHRHRV